MTTGKKTLVLVILSLTLLLLASCDFTPAPTCIPTYDVTKIEDTNDGVCSAADCSLREAINNANACPGPHTINLPAGGYGLTLVGDNEDDGATGDLDLKNDIAIIGTGAPSIHGDGDRVMHIHSGATVTLDGIWITDGRAIVGGGILNEGDLYSPGLTCNFNIVEIPPGGMGDARGGCIFNAGSITLLGGNIWENSAEYGGAIFNNDGADLDLDSGTEIYMNHASDHGGGVWNGVGATVNTHSMAFRDNDAGLNGAAIWNHGTINTERTLFENNHAMGDGGAIYNWTDSYSYLYTTWIYDNSAAEGGGVYNDGGMVHIYQSSLTTNAAGSGSGGGAYNSNPLPGGGLLVKNTTISNNTAAVNGGGIYNDGNLDLTFITVAENTPDGIRVDGGAEIKIRSSALAYNAGVNCSGIPLDTLGHNIEEDGSCAFAGWNDLPAVDPLLEPLAIYSGWYPSHKLGTGSPAIDSGDPDRCVAEDQSLTPRPQGAACDRGAHENILDEASISGWTYIDANRNDIFDPTDGWMSGVQIHVHNGACPSAGPILETIFSDASGYYEVLALPSGDYCLETNPLGQTLYPDHIPVSLSPGDALTDINFRYLLSPIGDASISGLVWHDLCAVPYATPPTPPPGCITLPGGGLGADGVYDPAEPGIEGIKVKLFSGSCPALPVAPAAEVYTDINGEYSIPILEAGTWCVVVDALESPNDTILIPGSWTYPVRDADPAEFEVTLSAGEDAVDVNFGWDYQFLPEPEGEPAPDEKSGKIIKNAFCRKGPGTVYDTVTGHEIGAEFIALARSEDHLTRWYWIEDLLWKIRCWVSFSVVELEFDGDTLETRIAPPTPTPVPPTPTPIACHGKLNKEQCTDAGGKWNTNTNSCDCPPN